jgi:hypothetical protein
MNSPGSKAVQSNSKETCCRPASDLRLLASDPRPSSFPVIVALPLRPAMTRDCLLHHRAQPALACPHPILQGNLKQPKAGQGSPGQVKRIFFHLRLALDSSISLLRPPSPSRLPVLQTTGRFKGIQRNSKEFKGIQINSKETCCGPLSDFRLPTSALRGETSDFRLWTLDFGPWTLKLGLLFDILVFQTLRPALGHPDDTSARRSPRRAEERQAGFVAPLCTTLH